MCNKTVHVVLVRLKKDFVRSYEFSIARNFLTESFAIWSCKYLLFVCIYLSICSFSCTLYDDIASSIRMIVFFCCTILFVLFTVVFNRLRVDYVEEVKINTLESFFFLGRCKLRGDYFLTIISNYNIIHVCIRTILIQNADKIPSEKYRKNK